MGRIIDLLIHKERIEPEQRQKLRAAALLHDVGHYPYSHVLEMLDKEQARHRWLIQGASGQEPPGNPRGYPSHEKLTQLIITGRPDISTLLRKANLDPEEIASIVAGEHSDQLLNQLIHSSLDVDRMDYLVRDAIHTGVPYGRIDLHYLLNNLDVTSDGELAVLWKAATAAEHFLIARYFMKKVVYSHKTVFGFEALLRQVLFLLREEDELYSDGDKIVSLVSSSEFLDFHDGYVDTLIERRAQTDDELGTLCRAIRNRTPPQLVHEVAVLSQGKRSAEFAIFRKLREKQLPSLARRYRIPRSHWLFEDPGDLSFEDRAPWVALKDVASLEAGETGQLVNVMQSDGSVEKLVSSENSVIHHLSRLRLETARLYVVLGRSPEAKEKLESIRNDVAEWLTET